MKRKVNLNLIVLFTLLGFALLVSACASEPETSSNTTSPIPDLSVTAVATPIATPIPTDTPNGQLLQKDISSFFTAPFLDWSLEQWLDLGFSILIFLIFLRSGGRVISWGALQITKRTNTTDDDALFAAIKQPMKWLGAIIGFQIAYARLSFITRAWREILENVTFVLYVLVFTAMIWQLINYFLSLLHKRALDKGADEKSINRVLPLLQTFIKAAIVVISFVITLHHFGIEVTALIAALGISGFAISLAAKDTLTNMIAGLTIAVDRPFRIGDRIYSDDAGGWVDVQEIGIRTTKVRTRDNRAVVIPNSLLSEESVINYNYPDRNFRLQVDIGVAYSTDFDKTRQVLENAVRQVEGVMLDKPIQVLFIEFGDSAMIFRVRWWIADFANMRKMNDLVYQAIQEALVANEIVSPGPTYDINNHLDQEDANRLAAAFKNNDPKLNDG